MIPRSSSSTAPTLVLLPLEPLPSAQHPPLELLRGAAGALGALSWARGRGAEQRAPHREGLAGAGLAVSEHCGIVAVEAAEHLRRRPLGLTLLG